VPGSHLAGFILAAPLPIDTRIAASLVPCSFVPQFFSLYFFRLQLGKLVAFYQQRCITEALSSFSVSRVMQKQGPSRYRRDPLKTTTATLCVVLVLSALSIAQNPTLNPVPNTIFVGADGKFETAPDTALIQYNISAQADSAKDAYDQAAKQAEATRQVMRLNGIDPKSAEIGFFSVNPQYDWKNPKHKVIGYQVTTSVSLKLKDFSKIGPVTQQLAEASVSESQSLSYTLDSTDETKSKAVADAYRRARASAQSLAAASGRTLGELSYASVDTFENIRVMAPMQRRGPMAMAVQSPAPTEEFSPQNVTVTAHVNAMFVLK